MSALNPAGAMAPCNNVLAATSCFAGTGTIGLPK